MNNKQTYKKDDKVCVQIPIEGSTPSKHLALILSVAPTPTYYNQEPHFAVRYLDQKGIAAYQCVPQSWITGYADQEQTNDQQTIDY